MTSVTWFNAATSSSGTSNGTTNWTITDMVLKTGNNLITVTAHNDYGNTGTDSITVILLTSPSAIIFNSSSYRNGDIAKGANYLYAFSTEVSNPGKACLKRSVDGSVWSSDITVLSNLNLPHGGFCVYNVGGNDNIIVSALGNVKKSVDNGTTFASLTSLGNILDYTDVATNISMNPFRPDDGNIYITGNIGTTGIFLKKSTDAGLSWSDPYAITNFHSVTPLLMRTNSKLWCLYADRTSGDDVWIKNSTDWGKTWGLASKIYVGTLITSPCHAQYIDEQRCLLTISDVYSTASNSRGVYGYLWYSNNTFQIVGFETGAAFSNTDRHTYTGIAYQDSFGINYTSIWRFSPFIKTHYSYYTGITLATHSITITYPTNASTYYTNWGAIKLIGKASDDNTVTSVTWVNDKGGSGTMYMTPQWGGANVTWQSRGQIQLYDGVNVITVTTHDASGGTIVDVLEVTYEKMLPMIMITSPTGNSKYSTNAATINLGGTASDANGIATVVWRNIVNGASGTAAGAENWSVSGIPLNAGMNLIYVNVTDKAGNRNYDAIRVTLDTKTPIVTITDPTSDSTITIPGWHMVKLKGTASDDIDIALVIWYNAATGDSGTMYMTPQWGGANVTWETRGYMHVISGDNVITIIAMDSAGNTKTDMIVVTYTGLY